MLLSSVIVNTKKVEIEFPGLEGFKVEVAAVSREVSKKLRTDSETTRMDSKLRMPVTELDENKFIELFAAAAIKGWSGLKSSYLPKLLLVDEAKLGEADIPYNLENSIELLKHSQIFDGWINEQVFDIERFRD